MRLENSQVEKNVALQAKASGQGGLCLSEVGGHGIYGIYSAPRRISYLSRSQDVYLVRYLTAAQLL